MRFSKFDVAVLVSSGLCLLLGASFSRIVCWVWISLIFFGGVSLNPPSNRPPITDFLPTYQPIIYHRPPTKCTNNRPTDQGPIRNMRTRNSITNFKWISDKKIWDCVINTISRIWVIIFWLKLECVTEKVKSLKTYHTEAAFE